MKHINSIRHNKDTRAHIPSKEEAGYEEANEKVQSGKKCAGNSKKARERILLVKIFNQLV